MTKLGAFRKMNIATMFFCLGLCFVSLSVSPQVMPDKIPAMAAIPNTLPVAVKERFTQQSLGLETQLRDFRTASGAFNKKTAKDQTDEEYNTVQKMRTDYIKAVKQFNNNLACAQVDDLQNQFRSLTEEMNIDLQVLHNLGFDKTVEELEYYGNLEERQLEEAKHEFKEMLFDGMLISITKVAGTLGSLTTEQVDALNRLADAQGSPSLGNVVADAKDVHKALEILEKSKKVYELADETKKGDMLKAAAKLGGLVAKNPVYGLLLTADAWAVGLVYQSINAVQKVYALTKTVEGDLIILKQRSEKLKKEVDQFTSVKKQLAQLSSACNSVSLIK